MHSHGNCEPVGDAQVSLDACLLFPSQVEIGDGAIDHELSLQYQCPVGNPHLELTIFRLDDNLAFLQSFLFDCSRIEHQVRHNFRP